MQYFGVDPFSKQKIQRTNEKKKRRSKFSVGSSLKAKIAQSVCDVCVCGCVCGTCVCLCMAMCVSRGCTRQHPEC